MSIIDENSNVSNFGGLVKFLSYKKRKKKKKEKRW